VCTFLPACTCLYGLINEYFSVCDLKYRIRFPAIFHSMSTTHKYFIKRKAGRRRCEKGESRKVWSGAIMTSNGAVFDVAESRWQSINTTKLDANGWRDGHSWVLGREMKMDGARQTRLS
jgi:hypothetical protein